MGIQTQTDERLEPFGAYSESGISIVTDISNYALAPRRGYHGPTRQTPCFEIERFQYRAGKAFFVSNEQRVDGVYGRGIAETFITYGDAELQAVKGPRSTDIRSLTSPSADPLRVSWRRLILLPRTCALRDKCA